MMSIGELIDKLSIVNIKIWDATGKAHEAFKSEHQKKANKLFKQVELMNVQRWEIVDKINKFFKEKDDVFNKKTFKNKLKK